MFLTHLLLLKLLHIIQTETHTSYTNNGLLNSTKCISFILVYTCLSNIYKVSESILLNINLKNTNSNMTFQILEYIPMRNHPTKYNILILLHTDPNDRNELWEFL